MVLPLPKVVADVGPGGGIVTGMLGANALTKSNLENKYYGPSAEASIASKNTYARYLPAQILSQMLASPQLWQNASPEQLKALTQQSINSLVNPPDIQSLSGVKKKGDGLFSMLIDKLTGNKESQQPQQQSQNAFNNPVSPMGGGNGNGLGEGGSNRRMSENEVDEFSKERASSFNQGANPSYGQSSTNGLPSTAVTRAATNSQNPGSYGYDNPNALNIAAAKGLETTATGEASAQTDTWKGVIQRDSALANGAQENLTYLDELKNLYPKLGKYEKGNFLGVNLGRVPAITDTAQSIDMASNALANSVGRAREVGHITDAAKESYTNLKPNRGMNEAAFNNMVNFNEAMNKQITELPAFNDAALKAGLSPNQRQAVWTYYANKRPFWNAQKNIPNDQNLGTWEEFLTPQKVQEALSPRMQKMAAEEARKKAGLNKPKESKKSESKYSQADLEYTASKHNMTVEQVKKKLGIS